MSDDLRFPIGGFDESVSALSDRRGTFIETIETLPAKFRAAFSGLTEEQLGEPYRPGGWRLRQLAHHVADSHLNSFVRFKLGLTENEPTIKTYDEAAWANLADVQNAPVELSLMILDGIHARWTMLLRSMSEADFDRRIVHPERGRMSLGALLALYDWHCRHHTAHVTRLRERMNW